MVTRSAGLAVWELIFVFDYDGGQRLESREKWDHPPCTLQLRLSGIVQGELQTFGHEDRAPFMDRLRLAAA